jgi:glycosyltransferase involved in cell wall biosynthesis
MMSVLLATHNGADTIERTLEAMAGLDVPDGGWELLVVNNASTDDTEARVLAWKDRLPLACLAEPRLGKSFALNRGLSQTKGDLIVMTDDDVLPDRTWLTDIARVAALHPQCAAFGGAIVPAFEGPAPIVASSYFGLLYGASPDHGEGAIQPMRGTSLYDVSGANLTIRKSVRDAGHRFAEGYLIGQAGLMGEDTEFVRQLGASGLQIGFAPKARLRHIIHPHQTSWRWIHRRFYRHGRTTFLQARARGEPAGFPWRSLRGLLGSGLRWLLALARNDRTDAFRQSRALAYDLGAIRQAFSSQGKAP